MKQYEVRLITAASGNDEKELGLVTAGGVLKAVTNLEEGDTVIITRVEDRDNSVLGEAWSYERELPDDDQAAATG